MAKERFRPEYRDARRRRRCVKCGWNESEYAYGDQIEICPTCNHTPLKLEQVPLPKEPFDWYYLGAMVLVGLMLLGPALMLLGVFLEFLGFTIPWNV